MRCAGNLTGVLLAAGAGARFDASGRSAKLLAPLPDGRPVALAAADNLLRACGEVLAVLPAVSSVAAMRQSHVDTLARMLSAAGCRIVYCVDSTAGMGHTLAAGVRAAPDAHGWLIALADMPAIAPAMLRAVMAALAGPGGIALPVYRGKRGHPVAFGSAWRDRLAALQGDTGARHLLRDFPQAVVEVPCSEAGVLFDIDTADDLARAGMLRD